MAKVHVAHIEVHYHEVGPWGEARPAVYLRYLEQAATEAAAAAGFDPAWHAAAGGRWLVRRSTIDLPSPARGGDRLEVETWVERFRRVRSLRRYLVRRAGEGEVLLRGTTDWVYVDRASGRPRRVPEAIVVALGARGAGAVEPRPPRLFGEQMPPGAHRSRRRVELRDLDGLGHVNNGTYLDYLAEAALGALATVGWSLERLAAGGRHPRIVACSVEYVGQAVHGDEIECSTWVRRVTAERLDLGHLLRGARGAEVVRAVVSWAWADLRGQVVAVPGGLVAALAPLRAATAKAPGSAASAQPPSG